MKALLVEDNPADERLIREIVKESPGETFHFEHVTRLDSARERLRRESFDVVLLDLGLPDSQGMQTLQAMQEASGGVPIVVLTGLDDEGFALEAVRAGAQDYLVKGRFGRELLVRTVRYAVERKLAEAKVLRERQRLHDVLETLPFMICLLTPGYRVAFANRGFRERFGESQGRPCYEYRYGFSAPCEFCESYSVLKTGQLRHWELTTPGGSVMEVHDFPFSDTDGSPLILQTYNDITGRKRAEQALREQAALLDLTHDTVFVMDMDGVIKYWNRGAEEQYGWTAEEAVGRAVHDLLKTVFPAPPEQIQAELIRTGRWEGELLHSRKDETRVVVASRWALQRGEQGAPIAILETSNDITERKRAEEAVRRTEKELRSVIEAIPALVSCAAPDGSAALVNRRWTEYGLSAETAGAWENVIHPEDRRRFAEAWQESLATGKPLDIEARWRRATDGEYRWLLTRAVALRDEQGNILKWYSIHTDIQDRKRIEEALRQSEAYLAEAQRLSHTGSWAFDLASNKYVYASEEFCRIYEVGALQDWPAKEAVFRQIHAEDWDRVNAGFERSAREKVDTEIEFRIVLPSGTAKHIQLIRHPVLNDAGDVVRLVGSVIDITERKRAEEERERLGRLEADLRHLNRVSMMGELAASVAHEVNQPLAGLVTSASACQRWLAGDVPNLEKARETARRIVHDGKRAGEIIARIRALATRTAATRKEELDLNETIREVLALVGDKAKKQSVIIRGQFADDVSPVLGDRVQLQQVVLNLVMNAFEAMTNVGERARELVITTRNIDGDRVQATVEDSGVGLDSNLIDKIFDPFYTTKPSGMGMGLSISRSILEAHGGRLWATAKGGPGTAFHFTLPKYHDGESRSGVAAV
jgi:PAS domain S-box-containing protein